jgi:cytochrome P450 PksS
LHVNKRTHAIIAWRLTKQRNINMHSPITFDLASPQFKANPYPTYARLRQDAPVCRTSLSLGGKRTVWLVTRYDDVIALLRDQRFAKNRLNAQTPEQRAQAPWMPAFVRPLTRNMLDLDAPDHTRLRALVQKAFTPRLVEQFRPRIQMLADALLTKMQRNKHIELVNEYALIVPLTIITELLGVPTADQHMFHRWSSRIVSVSSSSDMVRSIPALWSFLRYLRKLIAQRRAEPRNDLITALVQAEAAGDTLSEDELLAMMILLLVAGHETTVNLIASGTLALLQHPEQREQLHQNPALITSAVEELVRFTSPVECATERYACEDVMIAGVTIPRGEMVLGVIGSANRDALHFDMPDTLDLKRERNRHLAFGLGAHYCLGAPLARLEAQIAITTLLDRLPNLRLAVEPQALRWRRNAILRGLQTLPVTF